MMVVYGLPYIYGMDMLHSQNVKLQKPLSFRVTIDFQVLGVVKIPVEQPTCILLGA